MNKIINVPYDISISTKKKLEKLLWVDNIPKNIKIIEKTKNIDVVLKNIMLQIGATSDILNIKCVVLCGPTGVGKTKFLNHLKKNFNLETINMDTMQVYDYISVGTGRTNLQNTKGSYMYGIYNPNKEFHIINYLIDTFISIKNIIKNGKMPIFEGASKSLLDVIIRIFPNLIIFGIKAINNDNIVSNITKRISKEFMINAIKELSEYIIKKKINYNSPVLKKNWVVYNLIISSFSKKQLTNSNFIENISSNDCIDELTKKCVKYNIKLHKLQYKNLSKIKKIIWFSNDVKSIEKLNKKFIELTN
jgi:tRNA A37 N6-isopentenylltransferase MiaA